MSVSVGQPPLDDGGPLSGKKMALGIVGITVVCGGLLGWYFYGPAGQRTVDHSADQGTWGLARTIAVAKPPEVAAAPPPKEEKQQAAAAAPAEKPHLAFGFYSLGNTKAAVSSTAAAGRAVGDDAYGVPGGAMQQSDYAQRMQSTGFADTTPVPPRQHPIYTIARNYEFDCLPSRPIASNLPGPIKCMIVGAPVWSEDPNNRNPLLPIGTEISGTIERGLSTGEDRLFVVWQEALTPAPQRFKIPLDALGADPMGQIGLPGDRDDHLWPKLKTTLMVSGIQLLTSLPQAALSQGHNNTYLSGIGGMTPSLSQLAFNHDMNIPTTLYRGPGQPIKVITTHAIDLVNYYRNKEVR